MKPRIGVSMNYARTEGGPERAYLDREYLDLWPRFGVVPFPIALTEDVDQIDAMLDCVDGVLFSGGLDLDPALWGRQQQPETILLHPRRQRFELKLYEMVQKRRLPIMGICLGIQIINVAHGGSLYQHLPDVPGQIDHGREGHTATHSVRLDKKGQFFDWLKTDSITVQSCHHQGVDRLGESLLASAVAADGVTEAIERLGYPFLMAVQWHPERDLDNPVNRTIVERFITAVQSHKKRKSSNATF